MENIAVDIDAGADCILEIQDTGRVTLYASKSQHLISQASNNPASQDRGSGHYPHIDDYHLAAPSVVCKPVVPASPENLLEKQTLRPDHARPAESESATSQAPQMIHSGTCYSVQSISAEHLPCLGGIISHCERL